MSNNLSLIIDYINDNLLYGSKITSDEVDSLLRKFSVSNNDKEIVYKKLESLNISIIHSRLSFKQKLHRLFNTIGSNKELRESDLISWFENENIESEMQELVKTTLSQSGYSIINDVFKEINIEDFGFLDDLNFDDLDTILNDDSFNEEVSKLKNVIDKSHNLDYLIQLHSNDTDIDKQSEALDNLVNANKKLVWKIALKYKQFATVSFDVDDMYQAGMQGLIKAADKFDVSMGNQFSTYASWWIRQNITRSIADYSTTIRIPVHMRDKIFKYVKAENDFWDNYGRVATKEELAEILEITPSDILDLQLYRDIGNLTSLETPIGSDEGSYLGEFIPDDKYQSPEEFVMENNLNSELEYIINSKLKPKEARILKFRFGLIDGKTHTLAEIGQAENVTRERIRQIEAKAIRKLKHPTILERLRDFYYDRE